MTFDDTKKLPNLIRFRLAADFLQIEHFRNRVVLEDMVASTNPNYLKSKPPCQVDYVRKSDIAELATAQARKKLFAIHGISAVETCSG